MYLDKVLEPSFGVDRWGPWGARQGSDVIE